MITIHLTGATGHQRTKSGEGFEVEEFYTGRVRLMPLSDRMHTKVVVDVERALEVRELEGVDGDRSFTRGTFWVQVGEASYTLGPDASPFEVLFEKVVRGLALGEIVGRTASDTGQVLLSESVARSHDVAEGIKQICPAYVSANEKTL